MSYRIDFRRYQMKKTWNAPQVVSVVAAKYAAANSITKPNPTQPEDHFFAGPQS
jgi:hypothetical protein